MNNPPNPPASEATLLDLFAGRFASDYDLSSWTHAIRTAKEEGLGKNGSHIIARWSYERAHAMLLERQNHITQPPSKAVLSTGTALIACERQRQIEEEGHALEKDDGHQSMELVKAAAAYLLSQLPSGMLRVGLYDLWPWDAKGFRPDGQLRNLVKSGALIAAEIDRLQRLEAKEQKGVSNG